MVFKLFGWPVKENIKCKDLSCFYENNYEFWNLYRKLHQNSSPPYYRCHCSVYGFSPWAVYGTNFIFIITAGGGNFSPAMGARNQVSIGLSYRPASLCSLATQFQTRFLESIPRPIAGLKFSAPGFQRRYDMNGVHIASAMLPPFGPIEGHKWFFQLSSQWESQKNQFVLISFGKIQFLPPCS